MTECVAWVQENSDVLQTAVAAFAAAQSDIDQLATLLGYFANLGDSSTLRDYGEVRANLLKSRALLSSQAEIYARLHKAATDLSELLAMREEAMPASAWADRAPSLLEGAPPQAPADQDADRLEPATMKSCRLSLSCSLLRSGGDTSLGEGCVAPVFLAASTN